VLTLLMAVLIIAPITFRRALRVHPTGLSLEILIES